jgi:hypothetical protein
MKPKSSVRWLARLRVLAVCLLIALVAGIELGLGESMATRVGQTSAGRTDALRVPSVDISDLIVAAP